MYGKKMSPVVAMLIVAVVLRMVVLVLKHPGFPPGWGGEMSSVASSLASGHGFGSPYWTDTGPTALVPPVYPAILAVIFLIFWNHVPAAGMAGGALSIFLSAAICLPVTSLAKSLFSEKSGRVAGWVWALLPITGYSDSLYLWNTSLYGLLLTTFLVVIFREKPSPSVKWWMGFGLFTGVLVLTEPVCLTVVGLSFLWVAWRLHTNSSAIKLIILSAFIAAVLPAIWVTRNRVVFGQMVFLRSGFGLELAKGILESEMALPFRNPEETRRYQKLGEVNYMKVRLAEAKLWVRQHPKAYLKKTTARMVGWWSGGKHIPIYWFYGKYRMAKRVLFALPGVGCIAGIILLFRRKNNAYAILAISIVAVYPVVYYLTHIDVRQRAPLEPFLVVLAVEAGITALRRLKLKRSR